MARSGSAAEDELRYDARPMARLTRRGWAFTVVTVALALIAAFLPDLVGAGWHLLYGPSIRYRGWQIPVPRGWFAMHQGEGIVIGRMLALALWRPAPTAVFLPIHVTPEFVFDQKIWEEEQVAIQGHRGYRLDKGEAVVVAVRPGYCWEFSATAHPRHLWITCIIPADRMSVDYSGGPEFVPVFFSMLARITTRARER